MGSMGKNGWYKSILQKVDTASGILSHQQHPPVKAKCGRSQVYTKVDLIYQGIYYKICKFFRTTKPIQPLGLPLEMEK